MSVIGRKETAVAGGGRGTTGGRSYFFINKGGLTSKRGGTWVCNSSPSRRIQDLRFRT